MHLAGEFPEGEWRTVAGTLTAPELEASCAELGVPLDRARLIYWQRVGVFPLPEVRWLSRPGVSGGSRGYYHRDSPALARLLNMLLGTKADGRRRRPSPTSVRTLLAHWWAEVDGDEGAFYNRVESVLRDDKPHPLAVVELATGNPTRGATRGARRSAGPRWRTMRGTLTATELERACGALGVHLDRARRTYWQAVGVFPYPEVRWLSRPGHQGGARGYYHEDAPLLATLVDYALRRDHPAKQTRWRCSTPAFRDCLNAWRAAADDTGAEPECAEAEFYQRVCAEVAKIGTDETIRGIDPHHADVLPSSARISAEDSEAALRLTAAAVQALADAWVAEQDDDEPIERLVVWFRLERDGPLDWRIAAAGVRPTSHDAHRRRLRQRSEQPPFPPAPERLRDSQGSPLRLITDS